MHAEEDALRKLPPPCGGRGGRDERVDLLVVRTTARGKLGLSRPCAHCLQRLARDLPARGYRLCDVYYTDADGGVARERFARMTSDHVSRFYGRSGYFVTKG